MPTCWQISREKALLPWFIRLFSRVPFAVQSAKLRFKSAIESI
jgi:hypothetical protein